MVHGCSCSADIPVRERFSSGQSFVVGHGFSRADRNTSLDHARGCPIQADFAWVGLWAWLFIDHRLPTTGALSSRLCRGVSSATSTHATTSTSSLSVATDANRSWTVRAPGIYSRALSSERASVTSSLSPDTW